MIIGEKETFIKENIAITAEKIKHDINGNPRYKLTVQVNGYDWFKSLYLPRNNKKDMSYTMQTHNLYEYVQAVFEEIQELI